MPCCLPCGGKCGCCPQQKLCLKFTPQRFGLFCCNTPRLYVSAPKCCPRCPENASCCKPKCCNPLAPCCVTISEPKPCCPSPCCNKPIYFCPHPCAPRIDPRCNPPRILATLSCAYC